MMTPAGFDHGRIVARIGARLTNFVEQHGLGVVTGAETGFQLARDPDTVRAPDVAFVRAERVPPGATPGFFQGAPDLAVEVVSPSDRAGELLQKIHDWLDAGCRAVWVVDPASGTISVYRGQGDTVIRKSADELSGDDILPGFKLSVAEIFAS